MSIRAILMSAAGVAPASGYRTTQPTTASTINTSNPRTTGIKFFAHGGGAMKDVVRGFTPTGFVSETDPGTGVVGHVVSGPSSVLSYDNDQSLAVKQGVPFLAAVWMRSRQPSGTWAGMFGRWDDISSTGWHFGIQGDQLRTNQGDSNNRYFGNVSASYNKSSVCFMLVYDGAGTIRTYVDGSPFGTPQSELAWSGGGTDTFRIGVGRSGAPSENMYGTYKAVGIWTGAGIPQAVADLSSLSSNPWQTLN